MFKKEHRREKLPRKVTLKSLENAALFYLQRYATSIENLRRVLMRRVDRSARAHGTDREEGSYFVDQILKRYCNAKLLDDAAYAAARAASMRQRGASGRAIRSNLLAKGVKSETINLVLNEQLKDSPATEFKAAFTYCRRRRLGPWRKVEREERREKDIASLARQGYSVDVALRVIDAVSIEELEMEMTSQSL